MYPKRKILVVILVMGLAALAAAVTVPVVLGVTGVVSGY